MSARLHLGVSYTGVGPQFLWDDPSNADRTAIETYVPVARTLEGGPFNAFFLGEGLRARENQPKHGAVQWIAAVPVPNVRPPAIPPRKSKNCWYHGTS